MSNSTDEMLIPPNAKRRRHSETDSENADENKDRLSDLPDCILLHILSFLSTKDAVQTCLLLSTRWKDLWKRIPDLTLSSLDFWTLKSFSKFVSRILTLRDGSIVLDRLDFVRDGVVEPHLIKRVLNYAVSHNVQQLALLVACDIDRIPSCIFSCQTLTCLELSVLHKDHALGRKTLFPKSLNLPALTSLHLKSFTFQSSDNDRAEPFLGCNRLNSLIIEECNLEDAQLLCISSATLVNLTMICIFCEDFYKLELSSPNLTSLALKGTPCLQLCGSNLSSVQQVYIESVMRIRSPATPIILLSWLLALADINSLTVSTTILQVLSSVPGLVKLKVPFLGRLESLKVMLTSAFDAKLGKVSWSQFVELMGEELRTSSPIPDGTVDFLLQNSPSAKVDVLGVHSSF